jgi:hypothetical protein
MDPLTGLSVACSVLQLVETAIKIGKELKEIHSKRSLAQNDDTKAWAQKLRTGSEEVKKAASGTNDLDAAIRREVESAVTSVHELDSILTSILLKASGQNVGTLKQWWRMKRNRGKIDDLVKKLESRDRVIQSLILKAM